MHLSGGNERLQAALQLSCGVLLLLQFSIWDSLRFTASCSTPVLYVVLSLLAPPSCDIGSKFSTGTFMIGPQLLGIAGAGVVVSQRLVCTAASCTAEALCRLEGVPAGL